MSSTFSGFFGGGGGTERVGSVRGGFYGDAAPDYERLDGRTIQRSTYPDLEVLFPIGKLTGTIRTLAASPTAIPVIATANHFVAAGANTANAVQFSSDGASWATSATAGSVAVSVLIQTPVRLIALSSTVQAAIVSSNLTPAATWTATSSGPTALTAGTSRGCYHAAGARAVAVHQSTGVSTLDDGSTTWVARTSTARQGVTSTGTRVIGIAPGTATASVSVDNGVTWADFTLPEAIAASQGGIASNGTGTVVITGAAAGLMVSYDHGVTWQVMQLVGVAPSDAWKVQFSGGCFIIPTTRGLMMSLDARDWQLDPNPVQSFGTGVGVARKGTTIVQIPGGSTTAYSFAESATEYLLPNLTALTPSISGAPTPLAPLYIRAQ